MRAPAFWAALAFVAGVVAADSFGLSTYLAGSVLALLIVASLVFLSRGWRLSSGLLLLTLLVAGLWRYEMATSDFPWNHISNFLDLEQKVGLSGQIVEEPDIRDDRTYLTISAEQLNWRGNEFEVTGKILAKIRHPSVKFNYGDRIVVYGYLFSPTGKRNPGAFDYKRYLNIKGVYGQVTVGSEEEVKIISGGGNFILSKIVAPARKYILRHFQESLSEPYDYFVAGFVLGEKRGMPEELRQKFTRTGTLHLMAVSGSNVALVLVFAYFLAALLRFPGPVKFVFLSLVIIFFALLTNLQPSVVRASVMAFLALLAFYTERDINFLNLVSFTVLVILFFNPQALYDISFQLSFASVAGIGILVPQLEAIYGRIFHQKPKLFYRWLILPFLVSAAAILSVAPLNVFYFNNFSLIGFVSNLVVVPLVGISVILASLSAAISIVFSPLANIIVAANWLVLKLTLAAVDFFAGFSFSLIKVPHPPPWVFWVYPTFILFLSFAHRSKKARLGLGLTILLSVTLLVTAKLQGGRIAETKITVLDISPATVLFIELPTHKRVLYLRESEPARFDYLERTVVPFLYKNGISWLDYLLIIDSAGNFESKLASLKSNFSIKKTYGLALNGPFAPLADSSIRLLPEEPLELEGVKLFVIHPDNRTEPAGVTFEFDDFVWLQIDRADFFSGLDRPTRLPVISCWNYKLFLEENRVNQTQVKMDEIVINGWDFGSTKTVERSLAETFPGKKLWWTRKCGAVEVRYQNGDFEFHPFLEE